MKVISIIICLLMVGQFAFANDSIPEKVIETVNKFSISMKQCPERIWTNYSWGDFNIYLIYLAQKKVYKWDGQTEEITLFDPSRLDERTLNGYYDFFELDGKKSMSIKMDRDYTDPFSLAIHEGFHYLGQENWAFPRGARGTDYPLDYQPRYFRKMLFIRLVEYFQNNTPASLSKAKYWQEQWKGFAPKEPLATTDGYEGTAKYVETMAKAISKLGCSAKNEDIKSVVLAEVEENYVNYLRPEAPSLDTEGYTVGSIAALILTLSQANTHWQQPVIKGISPLETLLAEIKPQKDEGLQTELATYKDKVTEVNADMGKLIDHYIENFHNTDYIRLQVPFNLSQRSGFSPKFFANIKDIPGLSLFPLAEGLNFISQNQLESLVLDTDSVIMSYYKDNPCNDSFVLVHKDNLYKTTDVLNKNIEFHVNSELVNGTFKAEEHVNKRGVKFLCWGQE